MNFPTIYELVALPMLFAQEVEDVGGPGGEEAVANDGGLFGNLWFPILIVGVLVFFMMLPKNDQKKHKEMLDSLKKNDRVITAGGIFGTIVAVRQEDPFVMLRVDETANSRLKVLKTSISRVITGDEKSDKGASEPESSSELKSV